MTLSSRHDPRVHETFVEIFNSITTIIAFNPKWRWMTSLRGALHDLKHKLHLNPGESAKCVDDLDRKVIFLSTPLGVITIYEQLSVRGNVRVTYEVPEVLCEKGLFMRSSDSLSLVSLQHIVSLEFAQAMTEIADELKFAA